MRRRYGAIAALTLLLLGVRLVSMAVVAQPGYTDAYYYASVASRLAHGDGLTADFIWNFVEAPRFLSLPVASHRFWMPLATAVQAAGIVLFGGALGDFRAAQLAIVIVAGAIPALTYAAARALGGAPGTALLAAAVAGLGGAFAPAWVSLDAFAPAAVLGTAFFLAFAAASRGSPSGGAMAGIAVGLLYLARTEGALFGLVVLWLVRRRATVRAGVAGAGLAVVIGLLWLGRNVTLGYPDDLLARAVLLLRYDEFFAVRPPTLDAFLGSPDQVLATRVSALATNAVTAAMAMLLILLVPLAIGMRRRWARQEVRAFVALALGVYLVQSLAFALHSVRGSYFHSLAAFFPFAVALAAIGAEDLFRTAGARMMNTVAAASLLAFAVVSAFALAQWDVDFNTPYRARIEAVPLLPPGPLIVADAAAWRWISGHPAILAPSDGPTTASCAAEVYIATTLVLEPAHFARYDDLYSSQRTDAFTWRGESGGIRFYSVRSDARCILATQ
jgi:hypothetical protein